MEVILLERVAKLGQMGDVVRVKDGFARNFLLPKGKALRATKENRSRFEGMKVELEARNLEQKSDAQKIAEKLDGQSFTVLRQAAEGGQLYGSVSPRDLATLVSDKGFAINRAQIALNTPIKTIGLHKVPVSLHPEVEVTISVAVARSAEEAERVARGEDITAVREDDAGGGGSGTRAGGRRGRGSVLRAGRGRGATHPPDRAGGAEAGNRRGEERLNSRYSSKEYGCGAGGAAATAALAGAGAAAAVWVSAGSDSLPTSMLSDGRRVLGPCCFPLSPSPLCAAACSECAGWLAPNAGRCRFLIALASLPTDAR